MDGWMNEENIVLCTMVLGQCLVLVSARSVKVTFSDF